jgi:hypothetical protein
MEPRNRFSRGSRRVVRNGRPCRGAAMAWRPWSRRGRRTGHAHTRVPQEPGRPLHLLGKSRREHRVTNSGPLADAPGGRGSEQRVRPGYRRAKETKRGGRGGGESERRIVPWKRGNRPEGPRRGKEAPGHETAGGTDARDTEPCYHLNRTTADSGQGRGREAAGEFVARRAGCRNWACPDPWGPGVGDHPGLPDRGGVGWA